MGWKVAYFEIKEKKEKKNAVIGGEKRERGNFWFKRETLRSKNIQKDRGQKSKTKGKK